MGSEFLMPSLGPDMEAGTLVAWKVHPGDAVKRGDIVALVETDKGIIDVEIFATGTVEKLLVEAGAHVPVGTVLAQLSNGEAAAAAPAMPPSAIPSSAIAAPAIPSPARPPAAQPSNPPNRRSKISPAARVRARELGLDVEVLKGTGPGAVITLDDVNRAARRGASEPKAAVSEPAHDMRR